jgi:hypothetical protein
MQIPIDTVTNAKGVQAEMLLIDEVNIPLIVGRHGEQNSYVCSTYSHYVRYAQEELWELGNPQLERAVYLALAGLGVVLHYGQVDDAVFLNNWLVSTNLYPALPAGAVANATVATSQRFPRHAIIWRSLYEYSNERTQTRPYLQELRDLGCILLPSRAIMLLDPQSGQHRQRRDVQKDLRLLQKTAYTWRIISKPTLQEAERMSELYRLLYIEKYSGENPQYTAQAFMQLLPTLLTFGVLERGGRIDGVVGFYCLDGVLAAPVLGYDTVLPQKLGLYRLLTIKLLLLAEAEDVIFHMSSGVLDFKRQRGASAVIEYTAVYVKHLPKAKQWVWFMLEWVLNKLAVPLMRRFLDK